MVTFISIEYSEPKILTWNLHHHSPSHLAVLFCLREKLARHVPLLDSPVNFAEQYSSLIVCQFGITMTFLRSKYVQANLFLIQQICFSYMIASSCQKPVRYVGCIFILLNDNRVICNLVAAVQLAKQIAQQFPISFLSGLLVKVPLTS